jgi:hypothetical protein
MKIIIRKLESGYEIEAPDEDILNLFQKLLGAITQNTEEQAKKVKEEFQDILGQILGGPA